MAIKPVVFSIKSEGSAVPYALVALWYTIIVYGGDPKLRTLGMSVCLPWFHRGVYEMFDTACFYYGLCVKRAHLRIGFSRGEKLSPRFSANLLWQPIGKRILVATPEDIQDGVMPKPHRYIRV